MIDTVIDKRIYLREYNDIQFQLGSLNLNGEVRIFLDWMPYSKVKVYIRVEANDISLYESLSQEGEVLNIASENIHVKVKYISISGSDGYREGLFVATEKWHIFKDGTSDSSILNKAEFDLPNFHLRREVTINTSDWQIQIEPTTENDKITKDLKRQGGHAITHHATVTTKDKKLLTVKEINKLREGLYYFFSFTRGFWIYPILFKGYDNSEVVWEDFNINRQSIEWQNVSTWLDAQHKEGIQDVGERFFLKWFDESWHSNLKTAVYWYINANIGSRGVEGAIIQNQAAFELLSWHVFVEIKNAISKDGFKSLKADDKIRLLLSETHIPNEVPPVLNNLFKIAKEHNLLEASQRLTVTRNMLVHPGHKKEEAFSKTKTLAECWVLGQWILSLVILNLIGYDGKYFNRLKEDQWEGVVEEVPWNKTSK